MPKSPSRGVVDARNTVALLCDACLPEGSEHLTLGMLTQSECDGCGVVLAAGPTGGWFTWITKEELKRIRREHGFDDR